MQQSSIIRCVADDCLFCVCLLRLRRRASGEGFEGYATPKIDVLAARIAASQEFCKIQKYVCMKKKALRLKRRLEQRGLASYSRSGDCVRTSGKGAAAMTRSARTATLVVLLCLPVLALSDVAAWAKHHRVGPYFSGPCPDRCKSTRLSICSACMGGIKTCAQQHVCSNNRSVVCGDESTVSVPCWNQRYRW